MLFSESIDLVNLTENFSRQHESLVVLREFWESKKSDRGLPSKSDFPPAELKPWLGHIALISVDHPSQRLRIRLMGVELVQYAGADYTGRWFDEFFTGEQLEKIVQPYHRCLETKAPVYSYAVREISPARRSLMHRLHLPCAADGSTIDTIIGCNYTMDEPGDFRPRLL